ncbi:MAG: FecCD family ABC transporter permease [Propionibacteriaceae bacterium]
MILIVAVLLLLSYAGALLLGDGLLLIGDLVNWIQGVSSSRIAWIFDARAARAATALLAGAALALAGALTQAVTRNPLADTGLLGVAGGAGVGALLLLNLGALGSGLISLGALVGAIISAGVVFGLSARSGWQPTRLVLVGLGVQAVTGALVTLLVVSIDPWNQSRAITWLGGSTYGAHWSNAAILLAVLIIAACCLLPLHRDLDLVALDEVSPRIWGVSVPKVRMAALAIAVMLTAGATAALGVVSFVGLVAPHAARMMVGSLHSRQLPLATLVGALLVLVADTVGRTTLAPMQLPVGLVCSLIGLPWFCWLLWRMRGNS